MTGRLAGDRVGVNDPRYPGVWIVRSVGPKNTLVEPEAGGRGLRAPHWMLTDPPSLNSAPALEPVGIPYVHYPLGAIVRLASPKYEGLWVVLADKGVKVNVARLGGDNDRYLRAPRVWLTLVDPAEVLKP